MAAIDLETTGTDPSTARVVEVGVVRVGGGRPPAAFHRRVHPGMPIPKAASAVHGITDADVAAAPAFAVVAPPLAAFLSGCDLAGFGLAGFDLPILTAEFARAGQPFRLAGRSVLDGLSVFRRNEPRNLTAAVRLYLGRDHVGAHGAAADAAAALAVVDAQTGRYGLPADPATWHRWLWPADVGGRFGVHQGRLVLAFGKHRGRTLAAVSAAEPGYLRWMLDRLALLDDARSFIEEALGVVPPEPA